MKKVLFLKRKKYYIQTNGFSKIIVNTIIRVQTHIKVIDTKFFRNNYKANFKNVQKTDLKSFSKTNKLKNNKLIYVFE